MKVFFYGENPKFASGMGNVGDALAQYLSQDHDITYYAKSKETEIEEDYHGYSIVGNPTQDPVGQQFFGYHFREKDYDAVVTNLNWRSLQWLDEPLNNFYMNRGTETDLILYTPIETEEYPPSFHERLLQDHLNTVHLVPFNEPSYRRMRDEWELDEYLVDEDLNGYVPHGVVRDVFKPIDPEDEPKLGQLRSEFGFSEDDFIVMFCGENWRRKNIDVLADAFSKFARDKDDVRLLLHTSPMPSRGQDKFFSGWNMSDLLNQYGIAGDSIVVKSHPAEHISVAQLSLEYNMADMYVLPTAGEGFSLTSLEAMSTGTPAIHTGVENLRWLCGDASLYVDQTYETCMRAGEVLHVPDANELAGKMSQLYYDEELRDELGTAGIERSKQFTWDQVGAEFVDHVEAAVET